MLQTKQSVAPLGKVTRVTLRNEELNAVTKWKHNALSRYSPLHGNSGSLTPCLLGSLQYVQSLPTLKLEIHNTK